MRRAFAVALMVFVVACGGTNQAASTPSPKQASLVDGSGCQPDRLQALTFAGPLTGKLTCSNPDASCTYTSKLHDFSGSLHAKSGRTDVLISFFILYRDPGDYSLATQEGALVAVDGPSHWASSSGVINILPLAARVAQGSMHATLDGKPGTLTLNGTWVCTLTQS